MIPTLLENYLKDNDNMSYREFADEISNQLGIPEAISYNSIYYWIKGANKPRPTLMNLLVKQGHGPLKELASEILKELKNSE
jgi:hypothetical protein